MGAQAWPQADTDQASALGLPAEIAFLADYGVPPAQLRRSAQLAERIGVSPGRQIIASGLVSEELFYRALAADLGLRFQSRPPPLQPGGNVSATLREGMAATSTHLESPVRFAVAPPPGPALRRFLAAKPHGRQDIVVMTPSTLAAELRRVNAERLACEVAWVDEAGLQRFSARTGMSWIQKVLGILLVGFLGAIGMLSPVTTVIGAALALGPLFFATVVLRLAALMEKGPVDLGREARWQIDDSRLPVYTIAVPIFGEEAVLDQLIGALAAIDYPALGSKLTKLR